MSYENFLESLNEQDKKRLSEQRKRVLYILEEKRLRNEKFKKECDAILFSEVQKIIGDNLAIAIIRDVDGKFYTVGQINFEGSSDCSEWGNDIDLEDYIQLIKIIDVKEYLK